MEITCQQLQQDMASDTPPTLIDVREDWEVAQAKLPYGQQHIPLGDIPHALDTLENISTPLIFICHKGIRSLQAAAVARAQGLEQSYSLRGGVSAWIRDIDPTLQDY